ncbi:hypothetical protein DAPPUDRAFT_258747 [Daphnia pulex]|uniref:Uncharacterized protein n=1 Tax=Daphnia pulex TaxID=6669 RepID=E9HFZ9_DAPPU|nr:hypothetical protein DAPPUDRAFT_258747 [Daphnia pulex]|eukprot:EFX69346.1 hypothetical protein DAPPUDRAFT_258747 [Daphnia pulex]
MDEKFLPEAPDRENNEGAMKGDEEKSKRKKTLQLLKNSKRQRKQEKAQNTDGWEADLCAEFQDNCSTDSEEEYD